MVGKVKEYGEWVDTGAYQGKRIAEKLDSEIGVKIAEYVRDYIQPIVANCDDFRKSNAEMFGALNESFAKFEELQTNDDGTIQSQQARFDEASNWIAANNEKYDKMGESAAGKILKDTLFEVAKIDKIAEFKEVLEKLVKERKFPSVKSVSEAVEQGVELGKACAELAKDSAMLSATTIWGLNMMACQIPLLVAKKAATYGLVEEGYSYKAKMAFVDKFHSDVEKKAFSLAIDKYTKTTFRAMWGALKKASIHVGIVAGYLNSADYPSESEIFERNVDEISRNLIDICPLLASSIAFSTARVESLEKVRNLEIKYHGAGKVSLDAELEGLWTSLNVLVEHPKALKENDIRAILKSTDFGSISELVQEVKQLHEVDQSLRRPAFSSMEERSSFYGSKEIQERLFQYLEKDKPTGYQSEYASLIDSYEALKTTHDKNFSEYYWSAREVNSSFLNNLSYSGGKKGVVLNRDLHTLSLSNFENFRKNNTYESLNVESEDHGIKEALSSVVVLKSGNLKPLPKDMAGVERSPVEMSLASKCVDDVLSAAEGIYKKAMANVDANSYKAARVFSRLMQMNDASDVNIFRALERGTNFADLNGWNYMVCSFDEASKRYPGFKEEFLKASTSFKSVMAFGEAERATQTFNGQGILSSEVVDLAERVSEMIGQDVGWNSRTNGTWELQRVLESDVFGGLSCQDAAKKIINDSGLLLVVAGMMKSIQKSGAFHSNEANENEVAGAKSKLRSHDSKEIKSDDKIVNGEIENRFHPGLEKMFLQDVFPEMDSSKKVISDLKNGNIKRMKRDEKIFDLMAAAVKNRLTKGAPIPDALGEVVGKIRSRNEALANPMPYVSITKSYKT